MSKTAMHMEATQTRFELDSDRTDDVFIEDIAYSLARTYRFNGHTRRPICVAEHSLRVESILHGQGATPRIRLLGLLHDATEAYVGDIPAPAKAMLGPNIRHLENRLFLRIWRSLVEPDAGPETAFLPDVVHAADREAFYLEAAALCTGIEPWDLESVAGLHVARERLKEPPYLVQAERVPTDVIACAFINRFMKVSKLMEEQTRGV